MGINPLEQHQERAADVLSYSPAAKKAWGNILKLTISLAKDPWETDVDIIADAVATLWDEADLWHRYNSDWLDSMTHIAWVEYEHQLKAVKAKTTEASVSQVTV